MFSQTVLNRRVNFSHLIVIHKLWLMNIIKTLKWIINNNKNLTQIFNISFGIWQSKRMNSITNRHTENTGTENIKFQFGGIHCRIRFEWRHYFRKDFDWVLKMETIIWGNNTVNLKFWGYLSSLIINWTETRMEL